MPEPDEPKATGPLSPEQAMATAAETTDLSAMAAHTAMEYFMGDAEPPGKNEKFPIELDFGTPDSPNPQKCWCRYLRPEDFNDAEERSSRKDAQGGFDGFDAYKRASWIFARACIEPNLGKALEARNAKAKKDNPDAPGFSDSAQLVAHVFAWQPGVLLRAETIIRRRARQMGDDDRAAREVEAGKT